MMDVFFIVIFYILWLGLVLKYIKLCVLIKNIKYKLLLLVKNAATENRTRA